MEINLNRQNAYKINVLNEELNLCKRKIVDADTTESQREYFVDRLLSLNEEIHREENKHFIGDN